jgi:hypothetical protein
MRILDAVELIDLPDNTICHFACDVEVGGQHFPAGHPVRRYKSNGDDTDSVAFYYQGNAWEFFEEGEIAIHEERVSGGVDASEIGNPKVGAASKKYSLRYLPLAANIEVNRALENGAVKYGVCNWRDTNVKASVYIDAALRHIAQWQEGQEDASDSTVHNLGHAMASLAIIIDAQAQGVLIDDRPTASKDTDQLLLRNA